jgi:UDP-N-acetylmuramate: L-alanyl-gamma-D-glutamyl-meso-diaminopimelate ligase
MTFTVSRNQEPVGTFTTTLVGEHNLYNQVASVASLIREGVSPEQLQSGFNSFKGIKRRQQVRGEPGGVTVIDDFAHHPTAVSVTLDALRMRFGGRRSWAIFEPRSATSRSNIFQEAYMRAFSSADKVIIAAPGDQSRLSDDEKMDSGALAAGIRAQGVDAVHLEHVDDIVATVAANAMERDVVAVLSNGAFGGIHSKLIDKLERRFGAGDAS